MNFNLTENQSILSDRSVVWDNQNAAWWYWFIYSVDIYWYYCLINKYNTFDYSETKDYIFQFIMKKYWLANEWVSFITLLFFRAKVFVCSFIVLKIFFSDLLGLRFFAIVLNYHRTATNPFMGFLSLSVLKRPIHSPHF